MDPRDAVRAEDWRHQHFGESLGAEYDFDATKATLDEISRLLGTPPPGCLYGHHDYGRYGSRTRELHELS